jgi:hypothetical protein
LYPSVIIGVDTEKLDKVQRDLRSERSQREVAERQIQKLQLALQMSLAERSALELRLAELESDRKR